MLDWRATALVAAGGALGTVARFAIQSVAGERLGEDFPWATFAINVAGSFAIGLVSQLAARDPALVPPTARLFLSVGVLGGFTTFSSFSLESVSLARAGSFVPAIAYAAGSVLAGSVAAVLGLLAGRSGSAL